MSLLYWYNESRHDDPDMTREPTQLDRAVNHSTGVDMYKDKGNTINSRYNTIKWTDRQVTN